MSYVDVAYADEYVNTHFLSVDERRFNWEALDNNDKEVLLQRSFEAIECLPFVGRKTNPDQPNAFPRYPFEEVPEAVKYAQVENAITLSDSSASEDAAFYEKLWQYGVESYSIGNLSERTSSGAWGRNVTASSSGVISAKAINLLKPFLNGSYNIRGFRP